jgi:uncharacterized LabA/DUF88 family protein
MVPKAVLSSPRTYNDDGIREAHMAYTNREMVFVDGTNLFHRLRSEKLHLRLGVQHLITKSLYDHRPGPFRIYCYTTQPEIERAHKEHGDNLLKNTRVVLGDSVNTKKGPVEKGVDALLVADLIYHAATKNLDMALLVSVDTDFAHAIRRVEDFGARTKVAGYCVPAIPDRLVKAADYSYVVSADELIEARIAVRSND